MTIDEFIQHLESFKRGGLSGDTPVAINISQDPGKLDLIEISSLTGIQQIVGGVDNVHCVAVEIA